MYKAWIDPSGQEHLVDTYQSHADWIWDNNFDFTDEEHVRSNGNETALLLNRGWLRVYGDSIQGVSPPARREVFEKVLRDAAKRYTRRPGSSLYVTLNRRSTNVPILPSGRIDTSVLWGDQRKEGRLTSTRIIAAADHVGVKIRASDNVLSAGEFPAGMRVDEFYVMEVENEDGFTYNLFQRQGAGDIAGASHNLFTATSWGTLKNEGYQLIDSGQKKIWVCSIYIDDGKARWGEISLPKWVWEGNLPPMKDVEEEKAKLKKDKKKPEKAESTSSKPKESTETVMAVGQYPTTLKPGELFLFTSSKDVWKVRYRTKSVNSPVVFTANSADKAAHFAAMELNKAWVCTEAKSDSAPTQWLWESIDLTPYKEKVDGEKSKSEDEVKKELAPEKDELTGIPADEQEVRKKTNAPAKLKWGDLYLVRDSIGWAVAQATFRLDDLENYGHPGEEQTPPSGHINTKEKALSFLVDEAAKGGQSTLYSLSYKDNLDLGAEPEDYVWEDITYSAEVIAEQLHPGESTKIKKEEPPFNSKEEIAKSSVDYIGWKLTLPMSSAPEGYSSEDVTLASGVDSKGFNVVHGKKVLSTLPSITLALKYAVTWIEDHELSQNKIWQKHATTSTWDENADSTATWTLLAKKEKNTKGPGATWTGSHGEITSANAKKKFHEPPAEIDSPTNLFPQGTVGIGEYYIRHQLPESATTSSWARQENWQILSREYKNSKPLTDYVRTTKYSEEEALAYIKQSTGGYNSIRQGEVWIVDYAGRGADSTFSNWRKVVINPEAEASNRKHVEKTKNLQRIYEVEYKFSKLLQARQSGPLPDRAEKTLALLQIELSRRVYEEFSLLIAGYEDWLDEAKTAYSQTVENNNIAFQVTYLRDRIKERLQSPQAVTIQGLRDDIVLMHKALTLAHHNASMGTFVYAPRASRGVERYLTKILDQLSEADTTSWDKELERMMNLPRGASLRVTAAKRIPVGTVIQNKSMFPEDLRLPEYQVGDLYIYQAMDSEYSVGGMNWGNGGSYSSLEEAKRVAELTMKNQDRGVYKQSSLWLRETVNAGEDFEDREYRWTLIARYAEAEKANESRVNIANLERIYEVERKVSSLLKARVEGPLADRAEKELILLRDELVRRVQDEYALLIEGYENWIDEATNVYNDPDPVVIDNISTQLKYLRRAPAVTAENLGESITRMHSALTLAHHSESMGSFVYAPRAGYQLEAYVVRELQRLSDLDTSDWDRETEKLLALPRGASLRLAVKDLLPGGLADGVQDDSFDKKELAEGVADESSEHTDNLEVAKEIAKDHLTKDPSYYAKESMRLSVSSLAN